MACPYNRRRGDFRGSRGHEESGIVFDFRARFLAEFTLSTQSEIP
jgi:hypothetical protein